MILMPAQLAAAGGCRGHPHTVAPTLPARWHHAPQKSQVREESVEFSNSSFTKLKIGLEVVTFKNGFTLPHQF